MSIKEREQLQAEFSILNSLRHPNIVAYYHREHLKSTQDLHLYMEYCGGGDLSQVVRKLKADNQYAEESFVWSIFCQLVTALYRCHYGVDAPEVGKNIMGPGNDMRPQGLRTKNQVMILHRDLKPENGKIKFGSGFIGASTYHPQYFSMLTTPSNWGTLACQNLCNPMISLQPMLAHPFTCRRKFAPLSDIRCTRTSGLSDASCTSSALETPHSTPELIFTWSKRSKTVDPIRCPAYIHRNCKMSSRVA